MSRRGAARRTERVSGAEGKGEPANDVPESERFDFVPAPAMGKAVLELAKSLMRHGLSPAEVASLFSHASAVLVQQAGGMPRDEWLALCEELHDASALEGDHILTAPGGSA